MAGVRTIPSWEGEVTFVISIPLWTTWEGCLHEGLPSHHSTPSLGCVLESIREREGLSFPGGTYKMLKNSGMGLQEETERKAMTDPQSTRSEVGGPLLNAGLMTTNLPGILSLLAGPMLSLHKSRDWGLIQATVTCFPSTFFCGLSFSPVSCPISQLLCLLYQSTHINLFPLPRHHRSGQERADQKPCMQTNEFSSVGQSEEMINTGWKILIWDAWAQKRSRFWKVLLWNIHPDLLVKHSYLIKTNKQQNPTTTTTKTKWFPKWFPNWNFSLESNQALVLDFRNIGIWDFLTLHLIKV